ncbi:MAG: TPM domain-containing protein [Nitrospirota bacterium]|nr:TPM domain-containing protein [Nitrospirota bacterium]
MTDSHSRNMLTWLTVGIMLSICSLSWGMSPPEQNLPTPLGYVSDYANVLDEEWYAQIRAVCKDLETITGVEMLVVTRDSIQPLPHAQDYATRLYEAWRIGTAQQERGLLLLVAVQDRQAVVVVGASLLAVVTPKKLDEISLKFLQPMFHSGSYGINVYRSVLTLALIAGQAPIPKEQSRPKRSAGFWMNLTAVLLMFYALWRFTRPERRHPFPRWRRGEYWGIGQGGFGGNFGGFGGGTRGQGLR